MNLIDLADNSLTMKLEHTGDNEVDSNTIELSLTRLDMNGSELECEHKFNMTRQSIDDLEDNLRYMLRKIQSYLNE